MLNAQNECYYIIPMIQNRLVCFYPALFNSANAVSPIKNEFYDFRQIKSPAEARLCLLILYYNTPDFITQHRCCVESNQLALLIYVNVSI